MIIAKLDCDHVNNWGFWVEFWVSDFRVYDRAAIKFRGADADINFNVTDYDGDIKQVSIVVDVTDWVLNILVFDSFSD